MSIEIIVIANDEMMRNLEIEEKAREQSRWHDLNVLSPEELLDLKKKLVRSSQNE